MVVSGGTHGNEYSGVYVLRRLETAADALAARYPSLQVETLLANPAAHAASEHAALSWCALPRAINNAAEASEALTAVDGVRKMLEERRTAAAAAAAPENDDE